MDFTLSKLLDSIDKQSEEIKTSMRATTEAYRKASQPKVPVERMLKEHKPLKEPRLADIIPEAEKRHGTPPGLVAFALNRETGSEKDPIGAVNAKSGARGPLQQVDSFVKQWKVADPHNPVDAVEGAAKALGHYVKVYNGNVHKAIAAYSWGPGNLAKYGLHRAPEETKQYIQAWEDWSSGKSTGRTPTEAFKSLLESPVSKWKQPKKER